MTDDDTAGINNAGNSSDAGTNSNSNQSDRQHVASNIDVKGLRAQ